MNLTEFQNICPLSNIPSVLEHGILSHAEASRCAHQSVALEDVQARRANKSVPGGQPLHQYANVYFHARNPMMSRVRDQAAKLCVLRVSLEILKIPGAVITDQNAASQYVRFSMPSRLGSMNLERIFARDWRHPNDQIEEWRHSSTKCAEALIPDRIPAQFLVGAFVFSAAAQTELEQFGFRLPIEVDPDLFFH